MMKRCIFFIGFLIFTGLRYNTATAQTYIMDRSATYTTCSGTFYDSGGLTGNYQNNQDVTVTFISSGGQDSHISVTFNSFHTQTHYFEESWSVNTVNDILYVYDGPDTSSPLIGTLMGQTGVGTIRSKGNSLTFKFVSHASYKTPPAGSRAGWEATIHCNAAAPDDITMIAGGTFITCGGHFYDSGGKNGDYMDFQDGIVTTLISGNGGNISVDFATFHTQTHYFEESWSVLTVSDILYVYDGPDTSSPLVGTLMGQTGTGTIRSTKNSLTFKFVSHAPYNTPQAGTRAGWEATIHCNAAVPDDITMIAGGTFTTCGGHFYDSGGKNGDYMDFQDGIVTTLISGNGGNISVDFATFHTQTHYFEESWSVTTVSDILYVYDGPGTSSPLIGILMGQTGIGTIRSTKNSLTFKFVSHAPYNTPPAGSRAGWEATIHCNSAAPDDITMIAGGTHITCGGHFYDSGGKDGNYMDYQDGIVTTLTSGLGWPVRVDFTSFHTQTEYNNSSWAVTPVSDILYVYDGPDTSSPLIANLKGQLDVGTICSSGNSLTFKFVSSAPYNTPPDGSRAGWEATIHCGLPSMRQINWSGYSWNVKDGTAGPGPNRWSGSNSNVWVDNDGNLHLKITKNGDQWKCAEIWLQKSLGYGEYTFQTMTNVENLDKNMVLGLFTYENDSRQININFSRWGNSSNPAGWYIVQPSTSESRKSFKLNLSGSYSTHQYNWSQNEIIFTSLHGHNTQDVIDRWKYNGSNNPPPGNEKVVLNFWLNNGQAPSNNQEAEVILKSFSFKKLGNVGDLAVQALNIDNTSKPLPGKNGIVKLYNNKKELIDEQKTNKDGIALFPGIPEGDDYYYQVFHNPVDPGTPFGQEYWGLKQSVMVLKNQTTKSVFIRNQPYCGAIKIYKGNQEVTGKSIEPNAEIRIVQEIINPSDISLKVKGKIILYTVSQTTHELTGEKYVEIAAKGTAKEEWTITPTSIGSYLSAGGVEVQIDNKMFVCDGEPNTFLKESRFKILKAIDGITKYYAILVGNGDGNPYEFKKDGPSFSDEYVTNSDIKFVSSTLKSSKTLWSSDRLITLVNDQVSVLSIIKSFSEISQNIDGDDVLLFFYSGHGFEEGLILYNQNFVSPHHLSLILNNYLPESTSSILLIGACQSGVFTDYFQINPRSNNAIIVAAERNENAPQISVNAFDVLASPFAYYFGESLKGFADSDKNGTVTVLETFIYIYSYLSVASFGRAHPQIVYTNNKGDLALATNINYLAGMPFVQSKYITGISSSSATSGGIIANVESTSKSAFIDINVIASKNSKILEKGVCWTTSPLPTVVLSTKTVESTDNLEFSSSITGLESFKTYHLRAYATTADSTFYGEDIEFSTFPKDTTAFLSTDCVSSIGLSEATSFGTINFNGGAEISSVGFCWNTTGNPSLECTFITSKATQVGIFNDTISGLSEGMTYYVRAFATNKYGTSYGKEIEFTTKSSMVIPTVRTKSVFSVEETKAISGGVILSDGGGTILEKGICWNTIPDPTVDLITKTSYGSGPAEFNSTVYGLSDSTTYHVRAYATNNAGTAYGENVVFTTTNKATPVETIQNTLLREICKIYPNPFTDKLTFEYSITKDGYIRLEIFNIYGQKVKIFRLNGQTKGMHRDNFDLSGLNDGLYVYKFHVDGTSKSGKILRKSNIGCQ